MEGLRFDAWTRRRFGLAAGGLAGSLVGLVGLEDAAGRKKKKKKKKNCYEPKRSCSTDDQCCSRHCLDDYNYCK